jgi:protoporphyrinogen oxidase
VKKLKKEDGKWLVSNGKTEKTYDELVSTIPIQKLVKVVDAPKVVKTAANALKYNSLVTVMIGVNRNKLNDLSWLYIPDKDVLPHRISFPSNFSPYVTPPGNSSVLAEITCHLGDGIWKMKDEELIARALKDLSRLNIINEKEVCFTKVARTEYAYVISDLDYKKNLNIINNYFNAIEISLVGRFSEYKYLNMDDCIESALNYVKNVITKKNVDLTCR